MVGAATVTTADVEAANGIIHVIDKVLMPPADEPEPTGPTCDEVIGIGASGLASTDRRSRLKSVKPYAGSGKTLI